MLVHDERALWNAMEYRISRELACSGDQALQRLRCDGLTPHEYDLHSELHSISGVAQCGPSDQEQWRFFLLLSPDTHSVADIDWQRLLPPDGATDWLYIHPERRLLVLDPLSARC